MLLTHFLKLAKSKIWFLIILIPIASGIEISVSYLLQTITDVATGKSSLNYSFLVLIVIVYVLLDTAVFFATSFLTQTTLNQIISSVRNKLLVALFRQKTGVGQDIQNVTNDYYNYFTETIDVLHDDYLQGTLSAYKQIWQFVIALSLSIMIKPILSLIIVLLCVPGIFLPFYQQANLKNNKNHVLDESKQTTRQLQNDTSGLRTIQLFNLQKQFQELFQHQNQNFLIAQNNDQLTRKKIDGISQFLNDFLYLGTWIIGIYFVLQKQITLGQLVAFSQLMIFISEPIQTASGLFSSILGSREAAKQIDHKITSYPTSNPKASLTNLKSLSYQNVSYFDNGQTILDDIELDFMVPNHYVLVGKSGSGKTSLINLPLSDAKISGTIEINQHPSTDYDLSNIYDHLGLLEQQSYIFDDTLENNLTLFSKIDNQKLFEVLNQVGLNKYADQNALNEQINSHSNLLSGGERRRLSLARLLLKQNEFNLFDEPLTGLDPKTSHDISNILTNLTSGWIVVTHQFDQQLFEKSHRIIVMDSGEITAQGKFNDKSVQTALKQLNLIH